METFIKKDLKSLLFVIAITIFGLALAVLLAYDLDEKTELGMIMAMLSMFFTSLSLFISIYKKRKVDRKKH